MASALGENTHRIQIRAALDRRSAEAFALALRKRLKQLGLDDATVTVEPAPDRPAPPSA